MPTYLRLLGHCVAIYPHDHRPAHVHVIGPDGRCVFDLNCPRGPLHLRSVTGISALCVRRFETAIEPELRQLCREWEKIHGAYY